MLGVAELELPQDLVGVLSSGHTFSFPPRALTVPGQATLGAHASAPGARGRIRVRVRVS